MLAGVALCMSALLSNYVAARDDGRYANEPLHAWFDQLASGKGLCCSFADGFKVENVDWDTRMAAIACDCMASGSRFLKTRW